MYQSIIDTEENIVDDNTSNGYEVYSVVSRL